VEDKESMDRMIIYGTVGSAVGLALGLFFYMKMPSTTMLVGTVILSVIPILLVLIFKRFKEKIPSGGVDLDFTYLIEHMLSVSTGKPPRSTLFDVVGKEDLYPGYQPLFRKIYVLGREWGYSFTQACHLVARKVSNKIVKEFLVRLGSVLAVGEDVELFLRTEYMTIISEYETHYNRVVDGARVFLGVYTSMLAASIFMLANFLLMAFFFGGSTSILVMSFLLVIVTVGSVAFLVFFLMPKEAFENKSKPRPKIYKVIDLLSLSAIFGTILVLFIVVRKMGLTGYSLAIILSVSGLLFLPPGFLAKRIEKRIREVDDFFPIFIRSYGMHLQTVPQMARALKPLLAAELGKLNTILERLYTRLENGIDPRVAWKFFSIETGSELARRSIRIFLDTVEKGGRVAEVGALLSDHHNTIVRLRKSRFQVGKTFETTTYMLHLSNVLITMFITSLLRNFTDILSTVQAHLPTEVLGSLFNTSLQVPLIDKLLLVFLLALTFFNALSITRAIPGVSRSFWYYYGLLSLISGAGVMAGTGLMKLILSSALSSLNQTVNFPLT
jgi:flagellar protein FlaJ